MTDPITAALAPEVVEAAAEAISKAISPPGSPFAHVHRTAARAAMTAAAPIIVAAVVRSLVEQSHDDEDSTLDTCDEEIAAVLASVAALRVELARTRGKLDIAQAIAVNCFGGRRAP